MQTYLTKIQILFVAGQRVNPDFTNAYLLKQANCSIPAELIKKKLLTREIAKLTEKICKISDFNSDINEDKGEIKN